MRNQKAKKNVGGELVRRLHRFTQDLPGEVDELRDRATVRSVRLPGPKKFSPAQVKKTRSKLAASQAVFAQFLGVSLGAVRDWEQGLKPPNGAACRLMEEINANPQYFAQRMHQLAQHTT